MYLSSSGNNTNKHIPIKTRNYLELASSHYTNGTGSALPVFIPVEILGFI